MFVIRRIHNTGTGFLGNQKLDLLEARPSRRPAIAAALGVALLLTIAPSPAVLGQDTADGSAGAPKIAVIDLEGLFVRSSFGTELKEKLQTLQDETQKELEDQRSQYAELEQSKLGKNADEQLAITRKLEDAERAVRHLRDDATRRATKLEQDSRLAFDQKLQPLFVTVQEESGFDLILNKAPGVVIFAGAALDITDEVLRRLSSE